MSVYTLRVAGVSHRQAKVKRCREGETLVLKREPHNKYDENAIAVLRRNGEQIGYIPQDHSEWVARVMDEGNDVEARIIRITGGTPDKPTSGVLIDIDTTPGTEWEENKAVENESKRRIVSKEAKAEEKKTGKGFWRWIFGG